MSQFEIYYPNSNNLFVELNFVESLDLDIESNTTTMTDMCGNTEARKNGDNNWTMDIEGVAPITKIDELKTLARSSDVWEIRTNIHEMNAVFKNFTITDIDKEVELEYYDDSGVKQEEYAVSFQGQLKEST